MEGLIAVAVIVCFLALLIHIASPGVQQISDEDADNWRDGLVEDDEDD